MWRKFDYLHPNTLDEACKLCLQEGYRIFAGGTDLLVKMKQGLENPRCLVDIKGIKGLDHIVYEEGVLRIGSLVTLRTLETSKIIQEKFGILSVAAGSMGSVQIRNRGTIGGNLCNASPAADLAPPLIVLGAKAKIVGCKGARTVDVKDFFIEPGVSTLQPGEVLFEVTVPETKRENIFLKYTVSNLTEIAIANIAVSAELENEMCKDVKIAMGSVAPTPLRMKKTEEVLRDRRITDELIRRAAQTASNEIQPISDIRASAEYRRGITKFLIKQAFESIMRRSR